MVRSRGVQQNRDPTHLPKPFRSGPTTYRPDTNDGRQRISASRTRKQRVSWRVFSPKPEDTRPNRELSISRRSYLDPTRSHPFLVSSQLDPWNRHQNLQDRTRFGEISAEPNFEKFEENQVKISSKFH